MAAAQIVAARGHVGESDGVDLWQTFASSCERFGCRRAYRLASDSEYITYQAALGRVMQLAAALEPHIAGSDTATTAEGQPKVASLLPNCPQYLEVFYACAGLRAITATLNTRLSAEELTALLGECPCPVLLAPTDAVQQVAALDLAALGIKVVVWVAPYTTPLAAQPDTEAACYVGGVANLAYTSLVGSKAGSAGAPSWAPSPLASADLGVQLFFTSGTTGKPKMIIHTHLNVYRWSLLSLAALDMKPGHSAEDQHCGLHAMPMFHIADNAFVWSLMMIGGRHAFLSVPPTDCLGMLSALSSERVSVVKFSPTTIAIACGFSAATFDKLDLSNMRWIWSGGAALADDLRTQAEDKFKCEIICGYGMTESVGPVSMSRGSYAGYEIIRGVNIKVMREDGSTAGPGENGEIMVHGDTVFKGYANLSAEDNAKCFTQEGWFHSGDMGNIDGKGLLHITGRIKDLIIVAGENVYAIEVEAVIAGIPAVKQVGVFGRPDRTFGEVVEAAIILRDGMTVPDSEVIAVCKAKLADFKVPKRVHFVESMPVTSLGKVIKAELKKQILAADEEAEKERKAAAAAKAAAAGGQGQGGGDPVKLLVGTIHEAFQLEVDPDEPLFDAGLSSMQAIELLGKLEDILGTDLPGSLLFEYPSVSEIVRYLEENNKLGNLAPGEGGALATAARQMSMRLAKAYTFVTSAIMRVRSFRQSKADAYMQLDEEDDESPMTQPYSQNNPLVILAQFLGFFVRPIVCACCFVPILFAAQQLYLRCGVVVTLAVSGPLIHGAAFCMMISAAFFKWLLLGRVQPGKHPLWGWFYIRWLVVHNLMRWVFRFLGIYRSTPLYNFYFRLFGLRCGSRVVIDTAWITDPDLVTLGDEAYLCRDVNIQPSYVFNGHLLLRRISVGQQVVLHHGACVLGGATIPDRAVVKAIATVSGKMVNKDSAAEEVVAAVPQEVEAVQSYSYSWAFLSLQFLGLLYIGYVIAVCGGVAGAVLYQLWRLADPPALSSSRLTQYVEKEYADAFFNVIMGLPLALWIILPWTYYICILITKLVVIGQFQGVLLLESAPAKADAFRRWLLVRMMDWWWFQVLAATTVMSELNVNLYRLLGAKIGTRVYFNAPYIVETDCLKIEDDCMVAWDTAFLPNHLDRVRPITLQRGACIANNCVVNDGSVLGENCLVGDLVSGPSGMTYTAGCLWTGKGKPLCVGRTSTPPPKTNMVGYWFAQFCLCFTQLVLPACANMPGAVAIVYKRRLFANLLRNEGASDELLVVVLFALMPLFIVVAMFCKLGVMILLKWVFLGRFKPGPTPKFMSYKYCSWVALDAVVFEMEMAYLNDIRGTAFACWWLWLLGAKVGRNVCQLGVVGGIETDLKSMGDNVCMNFNAKPLSHSLEHHMLTFGTCSIEAGATVGCRSIVEMDAVVPREAHIPSMTAVHAVRVTEAAAKLNKLTTVRKLPSFSGQEEGKGGKGEDKGAGSHVSITVRPTVARRATMVATNSVYFMD